MSRPRNRIRKGRPTQKDWNALSAVVLAYLSPLRGGSRPQTLLCELSRVAARCGMNIREALVWHQERRE